MISSRIGNQAKTIEIMADNLLLEMATLPWPIEPKPTLASCLFITVSKALHGYAICFSNTSSPEHLFLFFLP